MKLNRILQIGVAASICVLSAIASNAAHAGVNSTPENLTVDATITSSAVLTVASTDTTTTLTFTGNAGGTGTTATDTAIVTAQVTTAYNNSPQITLEAPDFTGTAGNNAVIPISDLSYTVTDNTTYADNFTTASTTSFPNAALSESGTSTAQVIATLSPGSGAYSFTQAFALTIPQNVNADDYSTTLTYDIIGA